MATIIQVSETSFIAGDPPETLPQGCHWCYWCEGTGLQYGDEGVEACSGCFGAATELCWMAPPEGLINRPEPTSHLHIYQA